MTDFEKIWDFHNLYKAHTVARRGKRTNRETIEFEMNLSENLTYLSQAIRNKTYRIKGYYHFSVYEPKERKIHALHYADRVVQHCLCDEVLVPLLDKHLIYDNAACRVGKGTHFSLNRLKLFLQKFYKKYGNEGYFLKCDIRKYFDSIDHAILKEKLRKVIKDEDVKWLLWQIIDSYETKPGKGLPLGNQTSQWFALYYLDGLDRLVKEKLHIKYYTRYMDDCVLIFHEKQYLKECLVKMKEVVEKDLLLEFNQKTQIFPICNGVDYLGFHFYMTKSGKIIKKVRTQTKKKYRKKLNLLKHEYARGECDLNEVQQIINSYEAHLSYGNTYCLRKKVMGEFALQRNFGV